MARALSELLLETQFDDISSKLVLSENEVILTEGVEDIFRIVKKMSPENLKEMIKKKVAQCKTSFKELEQKVEEIGYNPDAVKEHVKSYLLKYFDKRRMNNTEGLKRDSMKFVHDMNMKVDKSQVIFDLDKINPVKAVSASANYAKYLLVLFSLFVAANFLISFASLGYFPATALWFLFKILIDPILQTYYNTASAKLGVSKMHYSLHMFDTILRNVISIAFGNIGIVSALVDTVLKKMLTTTETKSNKQFIAAGEDPNVNRNLFILYRILGALVVAGIGSFTGL